MGAQCAVGGSVIGASKLLSAPCPVTGMRSGLSARWTKGAASGTGLGHDTERVTHVMDTGLSATAVLNLVNVRHGTEFDLVGALAGGRRVGHGGLPCRAGRMQCSSGRRMTPGLDDLRFLRWSAGCAFADARHPRGCSRVSPSRACRMGFRSLLTAMPEPGLPCRYLRFWRRSSYRPAWVSPRPRPGRHTSSGC